MAADLLETYGSGMLGLTVVMPGGGAIPALRDALCAEARGKALVLPRMLGIDALADSFAGLKRADSLTALLHLYRAFRSRHNPDETLAGFFPIGQVLLADFDLILRAGKKPEQVFAGMKSWEQTGASFADYMDEEQKQLMRNFSSLFRDGMQESRLRFLRLWENLPSVFAAMEESLLAEGKGTPGMIYREALRKLLNLRAGADQRFYFAGFSSPSVLETNMMKHLAVQGLAGFAWDVPSGFSDKPMHEVSRIFSRLERQQEFAPSVKDWRRRCAHESRVRVRELSCPGLAGMAQWILSSSIPFSSSCAFILSDPALIQLLAGRGKPDSGRQLRFSMGFPLAYTALARWLHKVLIWSGRPDKKYCMSFLPMAEDRHFCLFFPEAAAETARTFHGLNLPDTVAIARLPGLPEWVLCEDAARWLQAFSEWLDQAMASAGSDTWLQASLEKLREICRSVAGLAGLAGEEFSFPVLQAFINAGFQSASITLQSKDEPEWKAMGLYESRSLDFDRVVIAPADEGLFPSGGNGQSLLPDSVRRAFSLPLKEQASEDQAYQFYRLCLRAEEVILLSSAGAGSRRSRYLDQIEFGAYFSYSREELHFSSAMRLSPEIIKHRNPEQMERVLAYRASSRDDAPARKLSPSSLHSLISCPLRFHYQKVLSLEEPEQISGTEMSARDFGKWVHEGIQQLLSRFAGDRRWISKADFEKMQEHWDDVAEQVWNDIPDKTSAGALVDFPVELALGKIMARRFFAFMSDQPPMRWIANEYLIPEVKIGEGGAWWTVSGRADIVLEQEDGFLLLDLKTGGFKEKEKLLLRLDEEGNPAENKMVESKDYFQMITYNRLASEDPRFGGRKVRSCLFYLAKPEPELADPFARLAFGEEEKAFYSAFDGMLLRHLHAFSDSGRPVVQAGDPAVCQYCSFNAMCRR